MILNILLSLCTDIIFTDYFFSSAELITAVFIAFIKTSGTAIGIKQIHINLYSGQLHDSEHHLSVGSIHFFISILDNGYSVLIAINSQINAN